MRIALYVNTLDDEYQLSFFRNIQKKTRDYNMNLLCIQQEHLNPPQQGDELFPSRHIIGGDGILLLTSSMLETLQKPIADSLYKQFQDIPTVSIGDKLNQIHSILIRSRESMEQLMNHLIEQHQYRHFLFLSGPEDHNDNIVRLHVFKSSLENAKKKYPDITYDIIYGNYNENKATHAMNKYYEMHRDTPPDVVVAANDEMALGALKVLRTRTDYRWQQTAVTGFDDTDRAQLSQPSLTTIRQPYEQMAFTAVEQLHSLILKRNTDLLSRIDSSLVIRNSCGCTDSVHKQPEHGTDLDSALRATKISLQHMQKQTVRTTRYMRNTSLLTQTLNTSDSIMEIGTGIHEFLDNLEVKDFYLILFKNPVRDLPEEGLLFYRKTSDSEDLFGAQAEDVRLSDFFDQLFDSSIDSSVTRCVRYLRAGQDMYGLIVYDADDLAQPYVCNIAAYLASTMQRFRIQELEKARAEQLEQEVQRRTKDLKRSNELLQAESKRRIEVEAEVLKISELERMRFSMDLHDDICQRLAGLSMKCRGIAGMKTGTRQKIEELSDQIDETLSRTRQYAHDSYPVELNTLGPNQAMDNLCHLYQKQTGYQLEYSWTAPDPLDLSQNVQIAMFRILQEALHNTAKHAKATKVMVSISLVDEKLVLTIQDNGQGLESSRKNKRKESAGLGLRSMQYRADQIGAQFHIDSPEEGGTRITLQLPLANDRK